MYFKVLTIILFFAGLQVITYAFLIDFPELFKWGAIFFDEILFPLSLWYIISYIFYIFNIRLPEKKKQKDIFPYIKTKCESLYITYKSIVEAILKEKDKNLRYENIQKKEFLNACNSVSPWNGEFTFLVEYTYPFTTDLWGKIVQDREKCKRIIDDILQMMPYLDSTIISFVNKIRENLLKHTITLLKNKEKHKINSFVIRWVSFWEVYQEMEEFQKYLYKKYNINLN